MFTRRATGESPARPRTALLVLASFGVLIPHLAAQDTAKGRWEECAKNYRLIVAADKDLPSNFRDVGTEGASRLAAKVEEALVACRSYLGSCEQSPRTTEVHYYFAKFLYLLSSRHRNEIVKELQETSRRTGEKFPSDVFRDRMESYFGTAAGHAEKALLKLPASSPLRPPALQLLGQTRAGSGDHRGAREVYEKFLKEYPKHESVPVVTTTLGREYLNLELYDIGIRFLRNARKNEKIFRSPSYPYLEEALWKLYEAKGDLQGMLESAEGVLTAYPKHLEESSLGRYTREDFQRYLIFNGFRRGYSLFAMGDFEGARGAFREYADDLQRKATEGLADGSPLPPYGKIYLRRAETCFEVVDQLIGRPAPADFELLDLWVTTSKVTLENSRNKTIAVVFRGVGDTRSARFLENLDAFCASRPLLRLVSVSYLKGSANVLRQMEELREELASMGYEGAAGFDPDSERKSLIRAYKANVGSATFVVIDPEGKYVWFQQDPRGVDVNLAKSILSRVAKGTAKPAK